jgi:uncharacterized protein
VRLEAFWFLVCWVGHACLWTFFLNTLYGRPIRKSFLKPWRLFTGFVILFGLGPVFLTADVPACAGYLIFCAVVGGVVFPVITLMRNLRPTPAVITSTSTRTLDLWPELGSKLIGDGKWSWCPRLPGNCVFRVDFTDLTLTLKRLPAALDGLTVLQLSDFHFHGTPAAVYFERVLDEAAKSPTDVIVLAGDFVDTDHHHTWLDPLLGRLPTADHRFAVLGNHDEHHNPETLRAELGRVGYRVLGNTTQTTTIRGVEVTVSGHEGPWFPRPPEPPPPGERFHLCVSHSPDNIYWADGLGVDLMLSGHVHGGQIRLPIVGSIFVPSVFSRRFDDGVFVVGRTVLVVNRGLSGKEPLRFRCHPQVVRLTLRCP